MVKFSHPNSSIGNLNLRLSPTMVEWTYNLNTSIQNTYAGQVIQILSINYDHLILEGQFGKEGPKGRILNPNGTISERSSNGFKDWKNANRFATGLTQMTAYFQSYFAIASQGNDALAQGHYDQRPLTITYDGGIDGFERNWTGYAVHFPSYQRSLENFAPKWHIEFEIEEGDYDITLATTQDAINRIKNGVGYTPFSPFSDPVGALLVNKALTQQNIDNATIQYNNVLNNVFDHFKTMLPDMSDQQFNDFLNQANFSLPNVFNTFEKAVEASNSIYVPGTSAATGSTPTSPTSQDRITAGHLNRIGI